VADDASSMSRGANPPASRPEQGEPRGLRAQFGATFAAGKRLLQAHVDLAKAEMADIMDEVKKMVALIGAAIGILVVAGFLAYRGWTEKFRSKLESEGKTGKDGSAYVTFGKGGYLGKSVAIAIVGPLFLYAAFTHDPQKSGGLDEALHRLLQQPFGAPVLVLIALGFACYGLFCFAWARHLDR